MPQGLVWDILQYRDARQKEVYNQKIQALKFATELAQKTDDWSGVQRMLDVGFPDWGIKIKQPTVGGEKKKVAKPTDVAAGGGAPPGPPEEWFEEKMVGGTKVPLGYKQKEELLDRLGALGLPIRPEMKTEFLTGLKAPEEPTPTAWEQKTALFLATKPSIEEVKKYTGGLVAEGGATDWERKWAQLQKRKPSRKEVMKFLNAMVGEGGGKAGAYTLPQRLDDLRSVYKMKIQGLDREFGYEVQGQFFVRPENMEVYKAARERIMREYFEDERLVRMGKKPKYLEEPTEELAPAPQAIWKYVPGQGMVKQK